MLKEMKKKLEAEAKKEKPTVFWLKTDTLPPNAKAAYRLMETLTQLRILL
jgi:hypothetical protein